MKIEVFYFDGCPNFEPTLSLVRSVVSDLGLEADVELVKVKDVEDATRLRFFGSPTVQVDGVDVEPGAREGSDYAYGCRVYGRSGTPPRELIEEALSGGLAA